MKENRTGSIFEIFITFLKLGCFSFGGGYAMVSLIEHKVVEEKKWIEKEAIIDVFAVAGSLPGAIALNSSAFVGYFIAGIPGAIAALVGNLIPSTTIVLIISILFSHVSDSQIVQSIFNGIRPAVIGLISYAAYKIGTDTIDNCFSAIVFIFAFSFALFFHAQPLKLIGCGAVAGIIYVKFMKNYLGKTIIKNKSKGGKHAI